MDYYAYTCDCYTSCHAHSSCFVGLITLKTVSVVRRPHREVQSANTPQSSAALNLLEQQCRQCYGCRLNLDRMEVCACYID